MGTGTTQGITFTGHPDVTSEQMATGEILAAVGFKVTARQLSIGTVMGAVGVHSGITRHLTIYPDGTVRGKDIIDNQWAGVTPREILQGFGVVAR